MDSRRASRCLRTLRQLLGTVETLERGAVGSAEIEQIEGRRFLLRMLAASIDTFTEHGDADRPRFHHAEGPHRKFFADCPDTDYLRAAIRPGPNRSYRVTGRIPPGSCYVGVLLYGRGGRVAGSLTDRELDCDDDGNFELRIGTERRGDVSGVLSAVGQAVPADLEQRMRHSSTCSGPVAARALPARSPSTAIPATT